MDKKINTAKKTVGKAVTELKDIAKTDKKRDPLVKMGKKAKKGMC